MDFFFFFFCLFALYRTAPMAQGDSQARGLIGALVTGLHQSHSNMGSLTHWARPRMKPATSWFLVRFVDHCATTGTPRCHGFFKKIPWLSFPTESGGEEDVCSRDCLLLPTLFPRGLKEKKKWYWSLVRAGAWKVHLRGAIGVDHHSYQLRQLLSMEDRE